MPFDNTVRLLLAVLLSLGISACGSGGSSDPLVADNTSISTVESDEPLVVGAEQELPLDPLRSDLLSQSDFEAPGDQGATTLAQDNGDLLPAVFPTATMVDLSYAQSGADLIMQLNAALALPADISVNFTDCGTANAFFAAADANPVSPLISEGGAIFMCHELTELFADFFGNKDQAFAASIFVLMHELGHALVNQLSLPVLGIEESYVDGIAAVLVGESGLAEGSVLAGWFFGSQSQTPFFDSHRAGPQRLGDLACWGVGADPTLLEDPLIDNIAQQLIMGGRDCMAEYAQQLSALQAVLGPNIRGGLNNVLVTESDPSN